MDWSRYRYFSEDEFRCRCCGRANMDPEFMRQLNALRGRYAFPFRVTSGYRCPDHNASVSSTGRSGPHTTGKAADIALERREAFLVLSDAAQFGFTGIGVNQKGSGRFIHLDMLQPDEAPRPTVWSY